MSLLFSGRAQEVGAGVTETNLPRRWREGGNRAFELLKSLNMFVLQRKWIETKKLERIQFSCSAMSDSLWPHGPQPARPPCPSPTPGAYSNSCPLSRWCHPTISSSVVPFSCLLQSFPASGSFPISWFFVSGSQSTGVSASASDLSVRLTLWDPMDYTVHRILQASIQEWVAFSFSRGSSQPGDQTRIYCIAGEFFTTEPHGKPLRSTRC